MTERELFYQGAKINGVPHGSGINYYKNSGLPEYAGQWKEGCRDGHGVSYSTSGKILYEGQWSEDNRHGFGVSYRREGTLDYEGQWERGYMHGYGTLYLGTGEIQHEGLFYRGNCYEGDWQEKVGPHGEGYEYSILLGRNGPKIEDVYQGQYHNGLYHGKGTLYIENDTDDNYEHYNVYRGRFYRGERYSGAWKDRIGPHGLGVVRKLCDDSEIVRGLFSEGEFVREAQFPDEHEGLEDPTEIDRLSESDGVSDSMSDFSSEYDTDLEYLSDKNTACSETDSLSDGYRLEIDNQSTELWHQDSEVDSQC